MKKFAIALSALAALALPATGNAAPCRNAQGHFVKCPTTPAPAPTHAAPASHASPTAAHATARRPAASGAAHRCRNAKGQFAKCGTPGAKPA